MEATGYPDGKYPKYPRCPVCGRECDTIYKNTIDNEIVGCDECISREDPWEIPECTE
jgi:hypothetical protein